VDAETTQNPNFISDELKKHPSGGTATSMGELSLKQKSSIQPSTLAGGQFEVPLEKHFCKDCNVDQPIRSKHCKDCRFCVATFDHHCFWIGNCIGEKNRPFFFFYLNLQVFEMAALLWRPMLLIKDQSPHGFASLKDMLLLTVLLIAYSILTLALISLVAYHYYFLCANLTTCTSLR
jgi:hypothetical protein